MGGVTSILPLEPTLVLRLWSADQAEMTQGVGGAPPLSPPFPLLGSSPPTGRQRKAWCVCPGSLLFARLYHQNVTSVLLAHFSSHLLSPRYFSLQLLPPNRSHGFTVREEPSVPGWCTMDCQRGSHCNGKAGSVEGERLRWELEKEGSAQASAGLDGRLGIGR